MTHDEIQPDMTDEQLTAVAEAMLPVAEVGPWLAKTYDTVAKVLAHQGVQPVGPPFSRFHRLDAGRFAVEAGFPVASVIDASGDVRASSLSLPGGRVARTVHVGPYEEMEPAYAALTSWVREQGGEPLGDAWEVYFSDPQLEPDPTAWRTEVVQPYRVG